MENLKKYRIPIHNWRGKVEESIKVSISFVKRVNTIKIWNVVLKYIITVLVFSGTGKTEQSHVKEWNSTTIVQISLYSKITENE